MPKVIYEGVEIEVVNNQTVSNLELVGKIEPHELFVTDANNPAVKKKYALNIIDIEEQVESGKRLLNFERNKPKPFSTDDLMILSNKSETIKYFLEKYLTTTQDILSNISDTTLNEMKLFYNNFGDNVDTWQLERELAAIDNAAKEGEEVQGRKYYDGLGISMQDIAKDRALGRLREYYGKLSDQEKKAIDALPEIQQELKSLGIKSFADVFNRPADMCLAGSKNLCKIILESEYFSRQLKQIYGTSKTEQETVQPSVEDQQSQSVKQETKRVRDIVAEFEKPRREEPSQTSQIDTGQTVDERKAKLFPIESNDNSSIKKPLEVIKNNASEAFSFWKKLDRKTESNESGKSFTATTPRKK